MESPAYQINYSYVVLLVLLLIAYCFHHQVESFMLGEEEIDDGDPSQFLLSPENIERADVRTVDPETQARLEALLEAAGMPTPVLK